MSLLSTQSSWNVAWPTTLAAKAVMLVKTAVLFMMNSRAIEGGERCVWDALNE
jgi:hypothetical protein